jgi:hypothetical protein
MAANDLLASRSILAPESLMNSLKLLRALVPNGDHDQNLLDRNMPKRPVLFAVANQALEKFVIGIGDTARSVWGDKTNLPAILNEVLGLVRYLQTCPLFADAERLQSAAQALVRI